MIDKLKQILDEEEIYIMSLVDASEKVSIKGKELIQENARGNRTYFKRISEILKKEIIDVYSTSDD